MITYIMWQVVLLLSSFFAFFLWRWAVLGIAYMFAKLGCPGPAFMMLPLYTLSPVVSAATYFLLSYYIWSTQL